jgi:predicted Zn-ribbon and HTH transcriptional regulator
MDEFDSSTVYFKCNVCEFTFQEDPDRFPVKCLQCGSEDVYRI